LAEITLPFDDLLPLMIRLSSFTIMDASRHLMEGITKSVQNGVLPLLQSCKIIGLQDKQVCFSRQQIIDGDMLRANANTLTSTINNISESSGDGDDRSSSGRDNNSGSSGTHEDIHEANTSSNIPSTLTRHSARQQRAIAITITSSSSPKSSITSCPHANLSFYDNLPILDAIFSYLNGAEKLFIVQRVCGSGLRVSKHNGCGWSTVTLSSDYLLSIPSSTARAHAPQMASTAAVRRAAASAGLSFAWTYLIGSSRLSRVRHVELNQLRYHRLDYSPVYNPQYTDPPSNEKSGSLKADLVTVHRYFPRLLSLLLYEYLSVSLIYIAIAEPASQRLQPGMWVVYNVVSHVCGYIYMCILGRNWWW
jgi:hypothetical protein